MTNHFEEFILQIWRTVKQEVNSDILIRRFEILNIEI